MDYGVLPTGFIKMRLPEIRAAIIADLKQRLLDCLRIFKPAPTVCLGC